MSFELRKSLSYRFKFYLSAFLWISPVMILSACAHKDTTQYAPLTYDYLTPIFLNVGQISIQDHSNANQYPRDISNLSPTPPAMALNNMVNNRLKARGTSGKAIFTISRASLQENNDDAVYGQIDIRLDIYNNNNRKVGSIQVSTNHTYQTDHNKGDLDSRANLYDITQKMMQDVNVELEYQIRNHLEPWIVDATGTPISDSIKTQDLNDKASSTAVKHDMSPPDHRIIAPATNKPPASNADLNAVFPDGIPNNESAAPPVHDTQPVSSTKGKYPVGVLGTLPQSAISKKY